MELCGLRVCFPGETCRGRSAKAVEPPARVALLRLIRRFGVARRTGCRSHIEERRTRKELSAAGQLHRLGTYLLAPVLGCPSVNGDLLALLERALLPSIARQVLGVAELDRPGG